VSNDPSGPWIRVVHPNAFFRCLTVDKLLDHMDHVLANPQNHAQSHIRAGIAAMQREMVFTQKEAESCLTETLKLRTKLMKKTIATTQKDTP